MPQTGLTILSSEVSRDVWEQVDFGQQSLLLTGKVKLCSKCFSVSKHYFWFYSSGEK